MSNIKKNRNPKGQGTHYYHSSRNQWVVQVTTPEGERKTFYSKLLEKAYQKRDDFLRKQDRGLDMSVSYKLSTFLKEYLELTRNSVEYKTYTNYVSAAENYIIPELGTINLRKLGSNQITKAWNKIREDFKTRNPLDINTGISTIKHCQAFLSTALGNAVGRRLIDTNPCDYALTPKFVGQREIIVLDENEIALVLNHFEDTLPDFFPYVYIAFQTGMRRGELGALQWKDIDLLGMQIHVRRTWGKLEGGYGYKLPKTKNSERTIDLTVGATRFLTELKQKHMEVMDVSEDSHVFRFMYSSHRSRPLGGNITPDNITKIFKAAVVEVLQRDDVHFHNTRHSHAGLLLMMGVHPKVVQERLGHSSIQTTMDIYSALTPTMQRDAIKDFPLLTHSRS